MLFSPAVRFPVNPYSILSVIPLIYLISQMNSFDLFQLLQFRFHRRLGGEKSGYRITSSQVVINSVLHLISSWANTIVVPFSTEALSVPFSSLLLCRF